MMMDLRGDLTQERKTVARSLAYWQLARVALVWIRRKGRISWGIFFFPFLFFSLFYLAYDVLP